MMFLICGQLMRHPLIKLFHLSNLLQMPNNCWMVNVEFFSIFSCSCKRISFDDPLSCSLLTSSGWPLRSSCSRLSSPLQNFLNHHCTVHPLAVPDPNVLLILWVVSNSFMWSGRFAFLFWSLSLVLPLFERPLVPSSLLFVVWMGKQWKRWQTLFCWAPKSLQMVTAAMKLKDTCSLD